MVRGTTTTTTTTTTPSLMVAVGMGRCSVRNRHIHQWLNYRDLLSHTLLSACGCLSKGLLLLWHCYTMAVLVVVVISSMTELSSSSSSIIMAIISRYAARNTSGI